MGNLDHLLAGLKEGFKSLKGSPRELWITFATKFFASFSYFALSIVLTLFLTDEFGISDYKAGYIYGMWGTLAVLYGDLPPPAPRQHCPVGGANTPAGKGWRGSGRV